MEEGRKAVLLRLAPSPGSDSADLVLMLHRAAPFCKQSQHV
jgi:hypothetical protein